MCEVQFFESYRPAGVVQTLLARICITGEHSSNIFICRAKWTRIGESEPRIFDVGDLAGTLSD